MNIKDTLEGIAEKLQATGVRTVFGDPISAEGRTIVPVAKIAYGFGTGSGMSTRRTDSPQGPGGEGGGGGGGARAVPAGVIEITAEQTRFIPFDDWKPIATAAAVGFVVGMGVAAWATGRRAKGDRP
jgi:uncharacterized spore protein YtfJ